MSLIEEHEQSLSEVKDLKKQMKGHVEEEEFEEAAACKKKIKTLEANQKEAK